MFAVRLPTSDTCRQNGPGVVTVPEITEAALACTVLVTMIEQVVPAAVVVGDPTPTAMKIVEGGPAAVSAAADGRSTAPGPPSSYRIPNRSW